MVTTNDVNDLGQLIDSLDSPPSLTKRQIVERLRPQIEAALQRGISLKHVAETLLQAKFLIHPNTLRFYYNNPPACSRAEEGVARPVHSPAPRAAILHIARPSTSPPHASDQTDQPAPRPGTFTPKPELPLEEVLRRAQAEQQAREQARAATTTPEIQ